MILPAITAQAGDRRLRGWQTASGRFRAVDCSMCSDEDGERRRPRRDEDGGKRQDVRPPSLRLCRLLAPPPIAAQDGSRGWQTSLKWSPAAPCFTLALLTDIFRAGAR
jgi:hypothetical protein